LLVRPSSQNLEEKQRIESLFLNRHLLDKSVTEVIQDDVDASIF